MKHNLKTLRKIIGKSQYNPELINYCENLIKELQKLKQNHEPQVRDQHTRNKLIDEILGDIPHVGFEPASKGENQT